MKKRKGEPEKEPKYPIESVNSALRLLKLLQERPLRVSEAAEILGVAPSTAHRLLAMLKHHGIAEQDADSRTYRPGIALIQVGLSVVKRLDLRESARPHLEQLSRELGETVHLSIPNGTDILMIDSVESSQRLRVASLAGEVRPAHLRAAGWAYLAQLDQGELERLYPDRRIPGTDRYPETSRVDLFRKLEQVRENGYALRLDDESHIAAIAVALVDESGRVRGAVGLSLPMNRFDSSKLPGIVDAVRKTCKAIGELGARPPEDDLRPLRH
jgi:DNA-binding IclR family transcriptional regulator